jgi:molybdopterin synthase catalytic subunit
MKNSVRITKTPIDVDSIVSEVGDDSAGGTVVFIGTIRNINDGKSVDELEYETYREMGEKKVLEIESEAKARWPVKEIRAVHRYGKLKVGEVSVVVAVSSEHRKEAFEACRYVIDKMKRTLPLWKKERRKGKDVWVEGTPIEK